MEKEKKPVKKKFKNLEAALQEFSVDDLKFHLDVFKTNFKNSHIVWLKAVELEFDGMCYRFDDVELSPFFDIHI